MEIIKLFKDENGEWMTQLKGKVESIESLLAKLGLADEAKLKELFGEKMPKFEFLQEPDEKTTATLEIIKGILSKVLKQDDDDGKLGLDDLAGIAGKLGSLFGK